ncbi:relaxase/mobilization nuclease domain-containing protein [Pedomonas sp. V897]|uniref:relaxase/mobilization nuclease domain-containing protein n=1 Tax=Pedomonas sp. V897 TaxID=3446482 RepID=UPI003EE00B2C
MIVKRIRSQVRELRGSTRQLAARVLALSNYIVDADVDQLRQSARVAALSGYVLDMGDTADGILAGEKVEAYGSLSLVGPALPEWQMEMLAVAARAPRSRNPIEHYVLSWQEDEHPDPQQAKEAVGLFLETLGLERCQAIWALHANTDNDHIHIMVNRIDPATGKALQAGDGWDIDAAHRAIALIEDRQGWKQEEGALYFARQGRLFDARTNRPVDKQGRGKRRQEVEGRQDGRLPSEQRAALLEALRDAADWQDLHGRLAELEAAYERKGSGAVVRLGREEIKASTLGRHASLKAMEKRLGPYVPDQRPPSLGYEAYKQACRTELARIRQLRSEQFKRLEAHRQATLASLPGSLPPEMFQALKAAVNAEFASARRALSSAFAKAIDAFAQARLDPAQWLAASSPIAAPAVQLPSLFIPAGAQMPERPASVRLDDKAISARRRGFATQYHNDTNRALMVTDYRSVIIVHSVDPVSVRLALTLAARRWDVVRAEGSPRFLELCAQIAEREKIQLVGVDNQPLVPPVQRGRTVRTETVRTVPQTPVSVPVPATSPAPVQKPAEVPRQEAEIDRADAAPEEGVDLVQLWQWQRQNGRGR